MESAKETPESETTFKKPVLVGKIGGLPKKLKILTSTDKSSDHKVDDVRDVREITDVVEPPQASNSTENLKLFPYEEPQWSGLPEPSAGYTLEVLKNGSIVETIDLTKRPFWVFGRLQNCDVCMQHPTISRYHAVLQYRGQKNGNYNKGYYIYDLESTHGTFLNKNRLKPRNYVKVHVGHMLKLGCSTRTYILNGPEEDREEESELSMTELKQKRQLELLVRQQEEEEKRKKEEERGIDWGMGQDADEETDLSENPYAETNNEDLYVDNPKKTLRGFFEREGLDLEYDCVEQGIGQFSCKVELPIDDEMARPIFAEVFHKGKKKDAVVQCALEACRILDRHGLLRQATHESRKRKPKNWEENDYYDSDEDTFLDRTGSIEKKREKRMNAKAPQKAETYENLLEKEKKLSELIRVTEKDLIEAQQRLSSEEVKAETEVDTLDSFMIELKQSKPSKRSVSKLKSELLKLKQEHVNVIKLVNIAKPASLPPLVAEHAANTASTIVSSEKNISLPLFGKRKKIKLHLPEKPKDMRETTDNDEEEEMEDEEMVEKPAKKLTSVISVKEEGEKSKFKENSILLEKKAEIEDQPLLKEVKEPRKIKVDKSVKTENENKTKEQSKSKLQRHKEAANSSKRYPDYKDSEDYSMWVPPSDQTGDGKTVLNEKYGY